MAAEARGGDPDTVDVAIVGGGAAGLAAAIFAVRRVPGARAVVLDGARKIGAKILVSGGGRCNVTNRIVRATDYWGGNRHVIAAVLRAFPAPRAAAFFEELGVGLHEEERGKLFPDSNASRAVLDALVGECARLGVQIRTGWRVASVAPADGSWRVSDGNGQLLRARRVVLATGGLSLPKTGSDGGGLAIARALGHELIPTTPALVPLVLDGNVHQRLAGVSHDAAITVDGGGAGETSGRTRIRLRGPLLWTHFGISGPVALDASRHYLRSALLGGPATASLSFLPDLDFAGVERVLLGQDAAATEGRGRRVSTIRTALVRWLPASVVEALASLLCLDAGTQLAQLSRDDRRRLAHVLTGWELPVAGSRGYNYAEATAGGVSLDEIDRTTMESRRHRGLYLVGEMLDVDGRLGGFNFQWAWSSGWVAGQAIGRADGQGQGANAG